MKVKSSVFAVLPLVNSLLVVRTRFSQSATKGGGTKAASPGTVEDKEWRGRSVQCEEWFMNLVWEMRISDFGVSTLACGGCCGMRTENSPKIVW